MRLRDLKGLGPKTESILKDAGVETVEQLKALGPIPAFLQVKKVLHYSPSLNFLYALVGALENRSWQDVARNEKERLLTELDGHRELASLFDPGKAK